MTHKVLSLLRVTVNSSFGLSALRWRYIKRRERLWEPLLMLFGIGTFVVFFGYGAYRLLLAVTATGLAVGQPELSLGLTIVFSQILVLITSFFMVISVFYFSRDKTTLTPLPLRPGQIITAKFFALLLGEYVTISLIYVPALLAYNRYVPLGAGGWLVALLVFLLLPVLPMAITSIIAIGLMRGINRRHRDLLLYASTLLIVVIAILWPAVAARAPEAVDMQKYLEELISSRLGLVRAIAGYFPPALWATAAVSGFGSLEGLRYLLWTAGSALASVFVIGAMGNAFYARGLIGGDEAPRRRPEPASRSGRTAARPVGRALVAAPAQPLPALIRREWNLLSRTPIWMLNTVLPGLIIPPLMVVSIAIQDTLDDVIALMRNSPEHFVHIGAVLAALIVFTAAVSSLSATAISREGGRIWLSRVIPQPVELQIQAKLTLATVIAGLTAMPIILAAALVLRLPWPHIVFPSLIGLAGGFSLQAFGLRVDAARPMLQWLDPQEAVKRNFNSLAPLLLAVGYIGGGVMLISALARAGLDPAVFYGVFLAVTVLASVLLYRNLMGSARRLIERLEL